MNETTFKNLIIELIEENPFAMRAVLKILAVEYSNEVPSLCVTREERPRLMVNLDFVNENCSSEAEVKALVCHEFLHILLRHTEQLGKLTEADNLAMDAVINAIIHRELGAEYSSMMARYYQDSTGLMMILRPLNTEEATQMSYPSVAQSAPQWMRAWVSLYEGKMVVDDIKELAEEFKRSGSKNGRSIFIPSLYGDHDNLEKPPLLGNHDNLEKPLPKALEEALGHTMKTMNGGGIWRSPKSRAAGVSAYAALFTGEDIKMERWLQTTHAILKKHLEPDDKARPIRQDSTEYHLPVLSPRDRRSFFRSFWNPFIPEASWDTSSNRSRGSAQIYLDVSGSMYSEMPHLISLLGKLRQHIKMPFWAFSDEVTPARIEAGQLITRTSGGTSMMCVLDHIAETNPPSAVIITDGYIEAIEPQEVKKIRRTRLHAIVSRDGNTANLAHAGIDYSQLDRIPT